MLKTFGVKLRVKTIKVPTWYSNGLIMVRRDALDPDHPEHTYNWIKKHIGVQPEWFGYFKPSRKPHYADLDWYHREIAGW